MFRPTDAALDLARAQVGGLHHAGPAAGDDGEAGAAEPGGDLRARAFTSGWLAGVAREPADRHAPAHLPPARKPRASSSWMRCSLSGLGALRGDRRQPAPSSSSSGVAASGLGYGARPYRRRMVRGGGGQCEGMADETSKPPDREATAEAAPAESVPAAEPPAADPAPEPPAASSTPRPPHQNRPAAAAAWSHRTPSPLPPPHWNRPPPGPLRPRRSRPPTDGT